MDKAEKEVEAGADLQTVTGEGDLAQNRAAHLADKDAWVCRECQALRWADLDGDLV